MGHRGTTITTHGTEELKMLGVTVGKESTGKSEGRCKHAGQTG